MNATMCQLVIHSQGAQRWHSRGFVHDLLGLEEFGVDWPYTTCITFYLHIAC